MKSLVARFALRHRLSISFIVIALCAAGVYAALHMPSSVFPQTNFPRVIIMVRNGVMPADEMMATITRPIEESMKDIQGCETIRSSTGRGTAEIDVFFSWDVDMVRSELYVLSRLSQVRAELPATAQTDVYRMNFSVFPIIGISLTGSTGGVTAPWELARYDIKPKFLRIPGVARVDLVGGRIPEFSVIADPLRLAAARLSLTQVVDMLSKNTLVAPTGVHEENHSLYLTVVDGRVHTIADIENLPLTTADGKLVLLKSVARVERGAEPSLQIVTADGADAVLINIYSQPDASTVDIARQVQNLLPEIRAMLPPGMKLAFFYDQSEFVRASVRSVWDAIIFGLVLSILILFLFLRNAAVTLMAIVVIPLTVLITILAMKLCGQSFNLMTLGGVAAAIGLIIDDAIVVVEAICATATRNLPPHEAVESAMAEILPPLLGSTLTPVVVFIPLAFLTGIAGVFFRALALTMVIALITSLVLAVTITPALAAWVLRDSAADQTRRAESGPVFPSVLRLYEWVLQAALKNRWFTIGLSMLVLLAAVATYTRLQTDFLPAMDEGGFIVDYVARPGISLAESDRQIRQAEAILATIPEIESYSRRTGTALGVHLDEPNTGDFLVKLKNSRTRDTQQIIADVREKFRMALPKIDWEFPGILTDLIGDLTWADQPIEVKIFSTDTELLKKKAYHISEMLDQIPGVVDTYDGVVYTGPAIDLRVRFPDAARYGLTTSAIAGEVNAAMLGQIASTVLEGDHLINIRVKSDPLAIDRIDKLGQIPLRAADGTIIRLEQVADIEQEPGQLELERDDLRQDISVTALLQNRDLGGAMADVQSLIAHDPTIPPGMIEYGGLYQWQQESFRNLTIVLITAIVLVFLVALVEFRSFVEPIAIVFGAVLSTLGIVLSLLITNSTLNIVAFLGAIIGMGIVHKNGLLLLDSVKQFLSTGVDLRESLLLAGRRRLRPVLMTSLAAALGMLPLAWGFGSADLLKPLAITVIGAVCISVLLSLVATPTAYYVMRSIWPAKGPAD
jgi:CzcA family heavy metal efflux pump